MNPIQPVQPPAATRTINVVELVSPALAHVKRMLFQPFDLGKWVIIGFCAWLAYLGEAGSGSAGGNYNFGNHSHHNAANFRHALDQARDYLLNNLDWIIPLAALLLLLFDAPAVHKHGVAAAGAGVQAGVFALFPRAVWPGI